MVEVIILSMPLFALLMWRNDHVYKCRKYALDLVSKTIFEAIELNPFVAQTQQFWDIYYSYTSHGGMIMQLTAWDFNKLYPDLEKRLLEARDAVPKLTIEDARDKYIERLEKLGYKVTVDDIRQDDIRQDDQG